MRRATATDAKYTLIGRRLKVQPEVVMALKTRGFEFSNRKYTNLNELAQAMGISLSQIYRVRQGKRPINEKIIMGGTKGLPRI